MIGLAFDTETTGLPNNATMPLDKQPEIIEFYGCLFNDQNGKVVEEFDQLIHPTVVKQISEETTGHTGITNEMLKGKPKFASLAVNGTIIRMIGKAKFATGHNLSFDMEMLEFEYRRLNDTLKGAWNMPLICTVEQTVHLRGIRLSLSALHEYLFGEAFAGAHRAKVDVQAQVRCFMELKKRGEL